DAIAINSGTWTLDPVQTTGLKLGVLPVEEMLFFLMTNLIIGFGINLMLSPDSQQRASTWLANLRQRRPGR
ncbi:MAG: lycopene cyclase domain-containing protein, partial [Anaerolineales bacterium]|nr:lycopene cyclase domain-containing protein [Anaerolineales bacterium]